MANEKNLHPSEYQLSQEEAKKGGIASGEARREKRKLKFLAEQFGELGVKGVRQQIMQELGIPDDQMTRKMQAVVGLYNRAAKGDAAAFNALRDLLGEKPTDKIEMTGSIVQQEFKILIVTDGGERVKFPASEEEVDINKHEY